MTESTDQPQDAAADEQPDAEAQAAEPQHSEEKSDLDKAKDDVMDAVNEGKEKVADVAGKLKGRFGRKS